MSKVGDIFTLLSKIGGLIKILQSVFFLIVLPFVQFEFMYNMISRLYFAKTTRDELFQKKNDDNSDKNKKHLLSKFLNFGSIPKELKDSEFKNRIENHRIIKLRGFEQHLLMIHYYMKRIMPCIYKISCWSKKDRLTRMMERGN